MLLQPELPSEPRIVGQVQDRARTGDAGDVLRKDCLVTDERQNGPDPRRVEERRPVPRREGPGKTGGERTDPRKVEEACAGRNSPKGTSRCLSCTAAISPAPPLRSAAELRRCPSGP